MLALVDCGSGNLRSVAKALETAGAGEVCVTSDARIVERADRVVLPGVGAFADCMNGLRRADGLIEALDAAVRGRGRPFLGICVGMQILMQVGLEFEAADGLGWVAGRVERLAPGHGLKVPHMGWNRVEPAADTHLSAAWGGAADLYFVHSYAVRPDRTADVAGWCRYGDERFAAALQRDNLLAVQFHPEKSQGDGLRLLEAWLKRG